MERLADSSYGVTMPADQGDGLACAQYRDSSELEVDPSELCMHRGRDESSELDRDGGIAEEQWQRGRFVPASPVVSE